jgi:hypothetical protein
LLEALGDLLTAPALELALMLAWRRAIRQARSADEQTAGNSSFWPRASQGRFRRREKDWRLL